MTPGPRQPNKRWRDSRTVRSLKKSYDRFLKIRGTPREIAFGFALGLFVGMTPFMGFHTAIAVPMAALLKWNKISSALAVWITNPFSAPFIYGATYWVGARLIAFRTQYHVPDLEYTGLMKALHKAPEVIGVMIVGGIVIGLPLAIAGYYLSYAGIIKYRNSLKGKLGLKKHHLVEKGDIIKQRLKHK